MNIRLVALDLDRTTLDKNSHLSDENRAAIEAAISKGIHVCIASGRAFDTLPLEVLSVKGIEYAITGNGASIYRIAGKECLRSYLLEADDVSRIMELTKDDPVTYEAFIDGRAYAGEEYIREPGKYGATGHSINYVRNTRTLVEDIRGFIITHRYELDGMDIIMNDDALKADITSRIYSENMSVYMTSSIKQLLEISYKDAGKKNGVKFLADMLGIDRQSVAAFGDADNDLDMIEYAGCGIAVGNATETLKNAADYVTLNHDCNGVAYAFREILHIY